MRDQILATEENYCACISGLVEFVVRPLCEASMTHEGEIIGMDKVTRVFSNIEDIVIIHDALLRQLAERIRLDESDRVGDIFLNMRCAAGCSLSLSRGSSSGLPPTPPTSSSI